MHARYKDGYGIHHGSDVLDERSLVLFQVRAKSVLHGYSYEHADEAIVGTRELKRALKAARREKYEQAAAIHRHAQRRFIMEMAEKSQSDFDNTFTWEERKVMAAARSSGDRWRGAGDGLMEARRTIARGRGRHRRGARGCRAPRAVRGCWHHSGATPSVRLS